MLAKKMFPSEKEIEITRERHPFAPEDQLGKVKLKRWNWMQKTEAQLEASKVIDEKKGILEMNLALYFAARMRRCIVEAPPGFYEEVERGATKVKEITTNRIANLDPDVGDTIRDAVDELTGPTPEEKKTFLEPSEAENSTLG